REHGCSHHNRFWRDQMQINGLLLKCQSLAFKDPWSHLEQTFNSPLTERWEKVIRYFSLDNEVVEDKGLM
ncbi:MAG: hypothetical protein ACK5V3_06630, partial [Bdellovibrionales bacterium]